MAKKFFHVCAGIFLLVLSFQLGATTARGQSGATWFIESSNGGTPYVLTSSGDWWRYVPTYGWMNDLGNIFGAAGPRTIVSVLPGIALTSDGEVWYGGQSGGVWQNAGVPPLGPTPPVRESFGSLKVRYR